MNGAGIQLTPQFTLYFSLFLNSTSTDGHSTVRKEIQQSSPLFSTFDPGVLFGIRNEKAFKSKLLIGLTLLRALARPVFLRSTIRGSRLVSLAGYAVIISNRIGNIYQ